MRINRQWISHCKVCNTSLANVGSGRPKTVCGSCARSKRLAKMRHYSMIRSRKMGINPRQLPRITNRAILIETKLQIGECQLHPQFNNGERKFVVPGLEYLFDMDHLDRHTKHQTIAKMMASPVKEFRHELSKCQLVCAECHRRKTIENKDWQHIVKTLESQTTIGYCQQTLFDN